MHPPARHIDPGSRACRSREPISLRRLLPAASFVGCADIRVIGATERAEDCAPGTLFVPRPATLADIEHTAACAIRNGASALLVARPIVGLSVSQCIVPEVGRAYGQICETLAGRPMRGVRTVGIAGAGDAGAVTWLIRSILVHAGQPCGLFGTLENTDGIEQSPASPAVPDAKTFWDWMGQMRRQGIRYAAVELSGEMLEADWISNSELEVAGITRFSRDASAQIDDRGRNQNGMSRILELPRPGGTMLINQDDRSIAAFRARIPSHIDIVTFGVRRPAAFMASGIIATGTGTRFVLSIRGRQFELTTRLVGGETITNCLMAAAAVDALGFAPEEIVAGLEAPPPPTPLRAAC